MRRVRLVLLYLLISNFCLRTQAAMHRRADPVCCNFTDEGANYLFTEDCNCIQNSTIIAKNINANSGVTVSAPNIYFTAQTINMNDFHLHATHGISLSTSEGTQFTDSIISGTSISISGGSAPTLDDCHAVSFLNCSISLLSPPSLLHISGSSSTNIGCHGISFEDSYVTDGTIQMEGSGNVGVLVKSSTIIGDNISIIGTGFDVDGAGVHLEESLVEFASANIQGDSESSFGIHLVEPIFTFTDTPGCELVLDGTAQTEEEEILVQMDEDWELDLFSCSMTVESSLDSNKGISVEGTSESEFIGHELLRFDGKVDFKLSGSTTLYNGIFSTGDIEFDSQSVLCGEITGDKVRGKQSILADCAPGISQSAELNFVGATIHVEDVDGSIPVTMDGTSKVKIQGEVSPKKLL